MNQVNYHESIVIPTLQKKIQELQNTNLVLEVALLVEQAKNKEYLLNNQKEIDDSKGREQSMALVKQKLNDCSDAKRLLEQSKTNIENEWIREKGLKDNILEEYNKLKIFISQEKPQEKEQQISLKTKNIKVM